MVSTSVSPTALIVGGGIGGLCTALALARHGLASTVLERNQIGDTTGAGIQLSPNATRILFLLGLRDALCSTAMEPDKVVVRDGKSGAIRWELELGQSLKHQCGFPYLQIRRSDLIDILFDAVRKQERIAIREECQVETVAPKDDSVLATTSGNEFWGDYLVGADGIHSMVNQSVQNPGTPRFTGWQAWRTIVSSPKLHKGHKSSTTVWSGRLGHIVHYPIDSHGSANCVFITTSTGPKLESWRQPGELSELREYFRSWHGEVVNLIGELDPNRIFRWGLYRHPTKKRRWQAGRVALLGDAVHSVLPFLAQGAALAIEDAAVLSKCIAENQDNLESALIQYEKLRRRRVLRVQKRSEFMQSVYHLPQPLSSLIDWVAPIAGRSLVEDVFNFDASS